MRDQWKIIPQSIRTETCQETNLPTTLGKLMLFVGPFVHCFRIVWTWLCLDLIYTCSRKTNISHICFHNAEIDVNHILNDADLLISRTMEAIFVEYGHGKPLPPEGTWFYDLVSVWNHSQIAFSILTIVFSWFRLGRTNENVSLEQRKSIWRERTTTRKIPQTRKSRKWWMDHTT